MTYKVSSGTLNLCSLTLTHEMQAIAVDDRGRLSVCLSRSWAI